MENHSVVTDHMIFSDNLKFFMQLLDDIEKSRHTICIETYKFADDSIGEKIRDALTRKSRQGVKIKLLIDSWGAYVDEDFFKDMIAHGGQVRFFKKLKYTFDAFTKHHRRNHRKIIIIDNSICYIGSANITGYALNWRELNVRMEGEISRGFKKIFNDSWKIYEQNLFKQRAQLRQFNIGSFRIIRDIPSLRKQKVKKKLVELIKNSTTQILIETPYFLPGYMLRKHLMDATKRGVDVCIITPKQSDVGFVDVLRSKYLGLFYRNQVKMMFYTPSNLHAKLILVDHETFLFGTSNFDYRSFIYMFEIMLEGKDPDLFEDLAAHIKETLNDCEPFDYETWLRRPYIHRFFEQLLVPFRHYL